MADKFKENEGASGGTDISWVEDDIYIDPQYACSSICVTGFPKATSPETLIIHFQRKKNGGGDIIAVKMNRQGAAVITFDSPEVAKSVQEREQKLNHEVVLVVKPYNAEVFELVSADLCLATVELLTRGQTSSLLKQIAKKTGINWIETSSTFTVSGSMKQVEVSRVYLQQAVNQYGGIEELVKVRKKREQYSNTEESEFGLGSSGNEEEFERTDRAKIVEQIHHQNQEPDATQTKYTAPFTTPEIQYFKVEPKLMKLLLKAYEADLKSIETTFHVKVPREANKEKQIGLEPDSSCTVEEYETACDKFIALYQKMVPTVKMKRFSLKQSKNVVGARNKIREMGKNVPVLVEVAKDQKHWELFGQAHDLRAALDFLKKEKIEVIMESDKDTGEASDHAYEEPTGDDSPDSFEGGLKKGALETFMGKIKVSVSQGDLTCESVDVIVNPTNTRLQHVGGVAKVILKKGGEPIDKESKRIIKGRKQLKDGDAVITSAGKLPCKKIVHVVGPDCRNVDLSHGKKVLRQACLNSLRIAQEAKMTSIAMPAIGSGVYEMPKDACAEMMFDAVDEFIKKGDPKKKTITDIRFVNIDNASVQAFRKEFFTRYGYNQEGGHESLTLPLSGVEGATRLSRPSRGRGKGKNPSGPATNPSSLDGNNHHGTPSGKTAFNGTHPLSDFSDPSSVDLSYSGALKKNANGSGADGRREYFLPPDGRGSTIDEKKEEECPICLDAITKPRRLKCRHTFCTDCLQKALDASNKCPVCQEPQGALQGNQPPGHMDFRFDPHCHVPGYKGYGAIIIDYYFPSGKQGREHPNPGQWFDGTSRTAYLPDNREGKEVLQLLRRAFDARLVFTIGTSNTTGLSNQVTWNDIHHKTSLGGGPFHFGYPDPDYLKRVKEELAAKGIR